MSLFDDASLVYIPTGYKPTKNYSGKPSTGGADMTFSRASGATRVNSKGLVEKVRTNNLLQSNQFDTTWALSNASLTSGATDPNGGTTAWTIANTANSGIIQQAVTLAGLRTFSLYAKEGTHRYLYMGVYVGSGTESYANFDLQTGTISSGSMARIESVGGGWYRCTVYGADGTTGGVQIVPSNNASGSSTTTGNILIWRGQYESGDIATNYIETTSAAVSVGPVNDEPRLTYDPVNPTAPSLLMEPQRTNLITYSEQLDNAAWTIGSATLSSNATISPSGYQDADNIITTAANSVAGPTSISISANTATYTQSIFVKWISGYESFKLRSALTGGTSVALASSFNVRTGVINSTDTTAQIVDYGNGWYRVSHQITNNGTNTNFIFQLYPSNDAVNTNTIAFWGAQVEEGSYATSYIPTNATSVTRVADASSKTGISDLIGQTEGTLFLDFVWNGLGTASVDNPMFSIGLQEYGTSNIAIANYNGALYGRVIVGTTVEANISFGAMVAGTRYKAALAYANNDVIFYVNGVSYGSDTSASIPATSSAYLQNAYPNAKNVNKVLLFPTRLDNATLATLTSL